jgi:hypothetical protein
MPFVDLAGFPINCLRTQSHPDTAINLIAFYDQVAIKKMSSGRVENRQTMNARRIQVQTKNASSIFHPKELKADLKLKNTRKRLCRKYRTSILVLLALSAEEATVNTRYLHICIHFILPLSRLNIFSSIFGENMFLVLTNA